MQAHPTCELCVRASKGNMQAGLVSNQKASGGLLYKQISKQAVLVAPHARIQRCRFSGKLCRRRSANLLCPSLNQCQGMKIRWSATLVTMEEAVAVTDSLRFRRSRALGRGPFPMACSSRRGGVAPSSSEEECAPPLPLGPAWPLGRLRAESPWGHEAMSGGGPGGSWRLHWHGRGVEAQQPAEAEEAVR
jgi:hypothetical protein